MCGIAGFTGQGQPAALQNMLEAIAHRGPDDRGAYADGKINLGHNRLSIIDLSSSGHQPMADASGKIQVVFNGEIYNYRKLRESLRNKYVFKSATDTEVIIAAYLTYGKDNFLHLLDGMFAFALWDGRDQSLILARDRLGIKPLYWARIPSGIAFASELRALIRHPQVSTDLDREHIPSYLVFRYFHNPATAFRQIKKLQPGIALYLRQNVLTHKRYWAEDMAPRYENEEDSQQHLGQTIKNAVSTHVVADVPVAIMLSGGIDSSIIALCAAQCGVPIKTFTIGFEGQQDNEFVQAKRFADSLGLENIPIMVEPTHLDLLPQIVYFNDEPVAGPSSLAYYCALKEARKYATVILFGHGADEIVSGYEQLKILRSVHSMYRFPGLRMAAQAIAHILRTAFPQDAAFARLQGFVNAKTPLEEYFFLTAVCSPSEVQAMLSSETDRMMSLDPLDEIFSKYHDQETASIVFEQGGWLPDDILHRVDRMTMAHSLEGRVPFLDTSVVECAHGIGNMLKLKGKQEKYILRQAFKNELPEYVLTRRKQRFNTPIHHFFGKQYEQMVRELFTQNNTLTNEIFDKKGLLKLLDFRNKPSYRLFLRHNKLAGQFYARQIWNVAVYMLWYMTVVEKKDPIALGKQWFS